MIILAIDTALDACSAAVLDTTSGNTIAIESQAMQRGHAEALMPLIARVMKASGIGFAALDRIAVTTGPGSFTGLRVGLSAARGIDLHQRHVGPVLQPLADLQPGRARLAVDEHLVRHASPHPMKPPS